MEVFGLLVDVMADGFQFFADQRQFLHGCSQGNIFMKHGDLVGGQEFTGDFANAMAIALFAQFVQPVIGAGIYPCPDGVYEKAVLVGCFFCVA